MLIPRLLDVLSFLCAWKVLKADFVFCHFAVWARGGGSEKTCCVGTCGIRDFSRSIVSVFFCPKRCSAVTCWQCLFLKKNGPWKIADNHPVPEGHYLFVKNRQIFLHFQHHFVEKGKTFIVNDIVSRWLSPSINKKIRVGEKWVRNDGDPWRNIFSSSKLKQSVSLSFRHIWNCYHTKIISICAMHDIFLIIWCFSFLCRPKMDEDDIRDASAGRWTQQEHDLFVEGLNMYSKQWKLIADLIKTRTVVQVCR